MRNFRTAFVTGLLLTGVQAFGQQTDWSPSKAAGYLDKRLTWWSTWPSAAKEQGTFCVSCHTSTPYAISRTALHAPLGETTNAPIEQKLIDSVTKRVRMWHDMEPFYPDQTRGLPKTSESRGTESILNALVLVSRDVPSGKLSDDARLALGNMWALQFTVKGDASGSWAWLQFHNAPFEGDSQFYGNCLAAIAIGSAPGDYQADPKLQKGEDLLKAWLVKNMDAQTPLDRVVLLWASTKLHGLLTPEQQAKIASETIAKQRADGGFSMAEMTNGWKRHDNTPIDGSSDGYATGLVAYTLEQIPVKDAAPLNRAISWLKRSQLEADGRWPAVSLNNNRPVTSDTGLFMSDAATAYAVLALTNTR
jgi:squalene-hopene/tetraprenyl-beta-curcumene cyclase